MASRGTVADVDAPSLVVELGAAILRYREFINFHGERVCPVYLLACEYALSRGLEPQTQ